MKDVRSVNCISATSLSALFLYNDVPLGLSCVVNISEYFDAELCKNKEDKDKYIFPQLFRYSRDANACSLNIQEHVNKKLAVLLKKLVSNEYPSKKLFTIAKN